MGDCIRVLPQSVANQIAAGEVVVRPASVVKELVENAVDAGAEEIEVWVEQAGKALIRVVDDGQGMSPQDAELAFKRHATSKIREAADLFRLTTLGFRGEALASIAAVAQVTLRTRREEDELGTVVNISGSVLGERRGMALPRGASFTVRNLFFNVPARRRFLKSDQTEMNNIMVELERVALVNPGIGFKLYRDDVLTVDFRAVSERKRIEDVVGKGVSQELIGFEAETGIVKLWGYSGTPGSARARGLRQWLFVNGRFMKHAYFHRAIMQAYERLIPADRGVHYVCWMEVEPSAIDVNIHPTKTEIKFENEGAIWQILHAAVRSGLAKADAVPSIDFNRGEVPEIGTLKLEATPQQPQLQIEKGYDPRTKEEDGWESLMKHLKAASQPIQNSELRIQNEEVLPTGTERGEAVYLQMGGRWIVTGVRSGLMVIDQHRASVRILYDGLIEDLGCNGGAMETLLFPDVLTLSQTKAVAFRGWLSYFASVGFDIKDGGNGEFVIRGVPSRLRGMDAQLLLTELFDDLEANGHANDEKIRERIALSLARQGSVKPGQALSAAEMGNLVDGLFKCEQPNYSPDGGLIVLILKNEDLETRFK